MTTMTSTERAKEKKHQTLKDRRAYRTSLINRQEDIERKIRTVESEIRALEQK